MFLETKKGREKMTEYKYLMLSNILTTINKDISHKLYLDEVKKINKQVFNDSLLYEFSEKGCFKFKCIINLMLALSAIKAGDITAPDTNAKLSEMQLIITGSAMEDTSGNEFISKDSAREIWSGSGLMKIVWENIISNDDKNIINKLLVDSLGMSFIKKSQKNIDEMVKFYEPVSKKLIGKFGS